MKINTRVDGDKAVLALNGQLVRDEHLQSLGEKVEALLRDGCREFIIDLKSVSYVDSAGLGELVAIYVSVQREGTAVIRLTGLNRRLVDLTSVTGKLRDILEGEPGQAADSLNPRLRDMGWELRLAVALAILVIIGMMIVLR